MKRTQLHYQELQYQIECANYYVLAAGLVRRWLPGIATLFVVGYVLYKLF